MAANALSGSYVNKSMVNRLHDYRIPISSLTRTDEASRAGFVNSDTMDRVELSPEARALSRLNAPQTPPPAEGTIAARAGAATRLAVGETALAKSAQTQGPAVTMTPPPPAGTVAEPPTASGNDMAMTTPVPPNLNLMLETEQAPVVQVNTQREPEPAPESGFQTSDSNPSAPPPIHTAEGTVVREPENTTVRESVLPENKSPNNNRTEELTRMKEFLNIQNGASVSNGENAVNTGASSEITPEIQRNEQQILLQIVGSQLAQVLPPSSIISVLG